MNSPSSINDMCDKFVQQWDGQQTCVDRITNFVRTYLPSSMQHSCELIGELSKADLRQAWHQWSQLLEQFKMNFCYQTFLELWPRLPTAADYDQLRCAACRTSDNLMELVRCEADARMAWGDAIGPAYYREKYQAEISSHESKPRTLTVKFAPRLEQQRADLSVPLRGTIQVGRCSAPGQFIGAYENATGSHVLIAELHERGISRTQLRIQLLNPKYALIFNQSSSLPRTTTSTAQLPSGQYRLVRFPFMVKLPGVKLIAN